MRLQTFQLFFERFLDKIMSRRKTNGPSLFTAVQTTNKELIASLRKMLCKGIEENYYAKNYIVPLEEAHITITVFDTSDKEFARDEFNRVLEEHRHELSQMKADIEFAGLDHFGDKVLFAKPSDDGAGTMFLRRARDILEKEMIINNLNKMTNYCYNSYNPHLTLFHIKNANHDGVDLIHLAKQYKGNVFGKNEVTSIQLCEIGRRSNDGYFTVIEEFIF